MKKILALLLALTLMLCVASCGKDNVKDVDINKLLNDVADAYTDMEWDTFSFYYSNETDEDKKLEGWYASYLFTKDYEQEDVLDGYDYAMIVSGGKQVFEIVILKGTDKAATKALLEQRLEMKQDPTLEIYMPAEAQKLKKSEILFYGNYGILITSGDNSIAKGVIDAAFGTTSADPTATPEANNQGNDGIPTPEPNGGNTSQEIQVLVNRLIAYDQYFISGHCAYGATVTITGGEGEVTVKSDNGCFMAVVPMKQNTQYTLNVVATTADNKVSSKEITARGGSKGVPYIGDYGDMTVIVGDRYQCFFQACINDYIGRNVISTSTANKLTSAVQTKLADIKAEVIILVVPDPTTVYTEDVPSEYTAATETYRTQFDAAVAAGGMTVIDLTDVLTEHKNDALKIYQKTDSHWTQYGAYLGYYELMTHISKKFPDAAPRNLTEIFFENRWVIGGDMAYYLDIMNSDFEYWDVGGNKTYDQIAEYNLLPEYTNFAKYNIQMPTNSTLYWDNSCRSYFEEVGDKHTVKNNVSGGNLPTAYILRDSFSNQMYDMINERFSKVTWANLWSYGINTKTINEVNPDYVIIICNERVLSDVVSQFSSNRK